MVFGSEHKNVFEKKPGTRVRLDSIAADDFHPLCKLNVAPLAKFLAREIDDAVRLNTFPLQRVSRPGVERNDRNAQNESVSHFEARAAQDLAGRFGSDNGCQFIFFGKTGDRLGGARGVLVHKQDNPTVEGLRAETFGDHHD